jgi:hypothetical protein
VYGGGGPVLKKISAGVELNTVESELRFQWISSAVCLLLAHSAWAGNAIHLKNRTIGSLDGGSAKAGTHYMLQFRTFPDAGVRAELARRGVRVLGYVPDSTLMVASETIPDLGGLDVASIGSLAAFDKLSPQLVHSGRGAFLVMLHPDVTEASGRELIGGLGFIIIPRAGLLQGNYVVVGPGRNLAELAASDEVSYIYYAGLARSLIRCAFDGVRRRPHRSGRSGPVCRSEPRVAAVAGWRCGAELHVRIAHTAA